MDEHVALSIGQFRQAWRVMCTATPDHTTACLPGIEVLFSRLPVPFFNVAVLIDRIDAATSLRALAREACAAAAPHGCPWFLVVTHEALPGVDAPDILQTVGLVPMMSLTGMHAADVPPLTAAPAGLDLKVPRDDGACEAMVSLNEAAYGADLQSARRDLGAHRFWKDHYPVVGHVGGVPVTCSSVMMLDGYRYVAFVATSPGHQRRGYADAAMRRSLELTADAEGRRPSVLHATDAGRPVYERMGYAPISTHTLFLEERFLAPD
jgi:predicted N-acetyltransferase YhbS